MGAGRRRSVHRRRTVLAGGAVLEANYGMNNPEVVRPGQVRGCRDRQTSDKVSLLTARRARAIGH